MSSRHSRLAPQRKVDILLVFHSTTLGMAVVHEQLLATLEDLGVRVAAAAATEGRASILKVGYPFIDLVEAAGLRAATRRALRRFAPSATIFETASALLLEPLSDLGRAAVRFDAPAALNRLGWRNGWQRARQHRAFPRTRILLPATTEACVWARRAYPDTDTVPLFSPIGVAPSLDAPRRKVVTLYAGDPLKKGLDTAIRAWNLADLGGYELEVIGLTEPEGQAFLSSRGVIPRGRIGWRGRVSRLAYRQACGSAEIHLATPRFDEYAAAQLEAVSDGAILVTGTPSRGPYEPLEVARELCPELVAPSMDPNLLGRGLRRAAGMSEGARRTYRVNAGRVLTPYREEAFRRCLADEVLPRLLDGRP